MSYSSILLNGAQSNLVRASLNQICAFSISYVSIGEPSCALIQFKNDINLLKNFTIGTNIATCISIYPNFQFIGNYTFNGPNTIEFSHNMVWEGSITMSTTVKNKMQYQTVSTSIAVTSLLCEPAKIQIASQAPLFYKPCEIKRSEFIDVLAEVSLVCDVSLTNTKAWTIFSINPLDGTQLESISLENNPTLSYAELVIQPNTLAYGLYRLNFKITLQGIFSSDINHYIKIIPTGLTIMPLFGGAVEINIGSSQQLELNPVSYSIDNDGLLSFNQLQFKFYCQIQDNGVQMGYLTKSLNKKIDLMELKTDLNLNNSNTTCFNDSGRFQSKFKLKII